MARRKKEAPVSEQSGYESNGVATAEQPQATEATNGHPQPNGGAEKAQPVHKIRIRNCTGAIWSNSRQDGTTYLTFTVSRSYRDDRGEWHSSSSFGAPDGFLLAEVARQCAFWIVAQTQGEQIPF